MTYRSKVISISFLLLQACGLCAARDRAEVTLMLKPSEPGREVYQQAEAAFNAANPDVHFRIIWTDISEKIFLLAAADALPDLISIPDFQLINYGKELIDLRPLLERDANNAAEFYPQLLDAVTYQGELKLLPSLFNVPLLYYRVDLFREANIPPPDGNWRWEDYRRAAKALTRVGPDGQTQIWGTSIMDSWWAEWLSIVRQAGGDLMDANGELLIGQPATDQAVRFLHDLIHVDHSAPLPRERPAAWFASGRYAMDYAGHTTNWTIYRDKKTFPWEWDVAVLPAGPDGIHATGEFAVAGYGIWRKCKDKEAAWRVAKFLSGRQTGIEMCKAGIPPVRKDVARDEFLKGSLDERIAPKHREALLDTLLFARTVPKHKDFIPVAQNRITPAIAGLMRNPDAGEIDGLGAQLQKESAAYIKTLGVKPEANPSWFYVELAMAAALLGLLLRRAAKKSRRAWGRMGRDTEKNFVKFTWIWMVGMLVLFVGPMIASFYWSHTDYDVVDPVRYVGRANYEALLFDDPDLLHSLGITFYYAVFAVPMTLLVALATALLLNRNVRGMGVFRTLFYLPSLLPVAASGIMWAWVLNPQYGLINRLLKVAFGVQGPGWLSDPNWSVPSLMLISLWGFGGGMIIFLAGLKTIPGSLYEAASIDGADGLRRFIHVTLPCLSPVIFFNLTMGIIGSLQIFDVAYVIGTAGPGLGGPEHSTYFYVINLFEKSFVQLKMGLGSAMAWILFAIVLTLTAINFKLRKLWVHSEADR